MSDASSLLHVGTFGPSLFGKSRLNIQLADSYFKKSAIRSIVFDPNEDDVWPESARVFRTDKDLFWRTVWASKHCAVFVDESAETIKRDADLMPMFTRIRHCEHKMHVMGHEATNLLPGMRGQLSTLFLFRQVEKDAVIWANLFADKRILESISLGRFDFLHCQLAGDVVKKRLTF